MIGRRGWQRDKPVLPGPVLQLSNVRHSVVGRTLLNGADLRVDPGQSVSIVGPSGSGKTTLLNIAAGITVPDSGSVEVAGHCLNELVAPARSRLRLKEIGLLFQFGELLPELDCLQNVALPLRLLGLSRDEATHAASDWLSRLDVSAYASSRPEHLSGGEVLRVALARSVVHQPSLILADEPTGMLDETNTAKVIALLLECAAAWLPAVVVVTHDPFVAQQTDVVYHLVDGGLQSAATSSETPA